MKPSEILTSTIVEPRWVVQGMMARGTLVILAGEPGVGKSVLAYQLAFCVAAGLPFLDRRVEPTRVLYFDEENSLPDFMQYCKWVWQGLGCPDLRVLDEMLRLDHFTLGRDWEASMLLAATSFRPGLIVVDTATPALHIKDENDNAEAAHRIQGLRRIQQAASNETAVLILKHEKIQDEAGHRRTVRGAKTWIGQADSVIYHVRLRGRTRKDGLYRTCLEPDKSRAFGLASKIFVSPAWTDDSRKGLILKVDQGQVSGSDT